MADQQITQKRQIRDELSMALEERSRTADVNQAGSAVPFDRRSPTYPYEI